MTKQEQDFLEAYNERNTLIKILTILSERGEVGYGVQEWEQIDKDHEPNTPWEPFVTSLQEVGCINLDEENQIYRITAGGRDYLAALMKDWPPRDIRTRLGL